MLWDATFKSTFCFHILRFWANFCANAERIPYSSTIICHWQLRSCLIFPTKKEVIEGLSKQKTLYPANKYFQYSNLGLTLLGYLIEEVSGIPYNQYISDKILNPEIRNRIETSLVWGVWEVWIPEASTNHNWVIS